MPTVVYVHPDGRVNEIEAGSGTSVMRAAVQSGIDGIIGECGGQAMCATCHVYVDPDLDLPAPGEDEEEMLGCTAAERRPESRLGCQVRAGADDDDASVSDSHG